MYVATGRTAKAEVRDQYEIDGIVACLESRGHRAVLRSLARAGAECAGLSTGGPSVGAYFSGSQYGLRWSARYLRRPVNALGDIFFSADHIHLLEPLGPRLLVLEVRRHDAESQLEGFCEDVTQSAANSLDKRRLRGMKFEWVESNVNDARVDGRPHHVERKMESKRPEYGTTDSARSEFLASKANRAFLTRLSQSLGKSRSVDATQNTDGVDIEEFFKLGLMRKEFLVTCRADSHTICTVADAKQLELQPATSFRCTCGRLLRDELVQEIFALTAEATELLSNSKWMTIWITERLISSGIPLDRIVWNAVVGGDELDIKIDLLGETVFFELKDREFGLGDAYPFVTRVDRYDGDFGVVATMDRVADDVKSFFREQLREVPSGEVNVPRLSTLEGPAGIERGIPVLVDQMSRSAVTRTLARFQDTIGVNITGLVSAWMDQRNG